MADNIFRKIYQNLKDTFKVDVKMKEKGFTFDVEFDPKKKVNPNRSFSVAVKGYRNPVGGMLICALESTGSIPESHFVPKISNIANMFLFLNGKLLPDNSPSKITLSEYVFGDNLELGTDALNSDLEAHIDRCDKIELADGYTLYYTYIYPECLRAEFTHPKNGFGLSEAVHSHVFDRWIPTPNKGESIRFIDVDPSYGEEEDSVDAATKDGLKDWKAYLQSTYNGDTAVTAEVSMDQDGEPAVALVEILTEYLYSNILRTIQNNIHDETKSADACDIPWTNEDLQQSKWLAAVKKSTKNHDAWEKVKAAYVVDWS